MAGCTKRSEKEYYIASARCMEMKTYTGTIMTNEDEEVWFGKSDGYPSLTSARGSAHHFKDIKEIRPEQWDGMPWYFRLKPGTVKVFHISKVVVEDIREEEVEVKWN